MIITRRHGRRLIREGRAAIGGVVTGGPYWPEGNHYVIVDRYDRGRTDHYPATERDERELDAEQ